MILVTGAGGTVGREVVKALAAAGAKARAGFSSEDKADAARRRGLDAAVADFARPDTLAAALRGCDHLFLLSGGLRNQTELETAAVRAAKAAGVQHVVKLSAWGAGEEAHTFARWHRPVERELEGSGMGWTLLRPNGFMQNVVNFLAANIKAQSAIYQPAGSSAVSHVDVRDVAAVAAKVLTEPGHLSRTYTLSGPEALDWTQIAAKISALLGRAVTYVDVPEDGARQGMLGMGMPDWYVEAILDLARYYVAGHAGRVTPDVKQVLGREPLTFDRFLQDHAAALR